MTEPKFEHYTRMIDESDIFIWYANSHGFVTRKTKSTGKSITLNGYIKCGHVTVKIHGKENRLSGVIAKAFLYSYSKNLLVGFKDKNQSNCNVDNLYVYSYKMHGKRTGHLSKSISVSIKMKKQGTIQFRSVREAAKYLFVSYQTLLDYLNGQVKHSVLDQPGRKITWNKEGIIDG